MAQDVVVNGTTYPAVESVALLDESGNVTMYYPDAVRYTEQALTESQKAWARTNIGAIGSTELLEELAKRGQLKPEFAESFDWLKVNGDTTKLYVLPDGWIYAYMLTEVEVNAGASYTNLLPGATDTDRSTIYNGVGYKSGVRLSSSGSETSQAGMYVSGFISAKPGDVLRIKGTQAKQQVNSYIISYNSSNTKVVCVTVENGPYDVGWNPSKGTYEDGILTYTLSESVFGSGFDAIRLSAGLIDENTIVTINEEIKEGGTTVVKEYAWASTGHALVPADYEDRIIGLEKLAAGHTADIENLKKGVVSVTAIKDWNAPIYDDAAVFLLSEEKLATDTHTVEAVYAKYDALMAAHPGYITKTDLGLASDGSTHIYRYDFCEPRTRKYSGSAYHPDLVKPKAIIVSGIHSEYAGIYALYYALEEIANNAALYQDLRRNTHLIVVPCMNPYCLDIGNYSASNGRKNANGVEIHRNFEVEHVVIDPSSNNYGGEVPLSEVESRYIDSIMSENPDAAFFLTCHNFDTDNTFGTGFIWPSVATNYMYNMGSRLIDKMSRAWLDKYGSAFREGVDAVKTDNVADGDYTVGQVGISTTPGTETKHAMKYGIHGANVEIAKLFKVMEPTVTEPCSSQVMSRGAEVYINFLRMMFCCYDPKDKREYAPDLTQGE